MRKAPTVQRVAREALLTLLTVQTVQAMLTHRSKRAASASGFNQAIDFRLCQILAGAIRTIGQPPGASSRERIRGSVGEQAKGAIGKQYRPRTQAPPDHGSLTMCTPSISWCEMWVWRRPLKVIRRTPQRRMSSSNALPWRALDRDIGGRSEPLSFRQGD